MLVAVVGLALSVVVYVQYLPGLARFQCRSLAGVCSVV